MCFAQELSTNNTAEYESLLAGLRAAPRKDFHHLVLCGDSELVLNQVNKEYDCPQMAAYMEKIRKMERRFKGIQMEHIHRNQNIIVDELSKIAAKGLPVPQGGFRSTPFETVCKA
jgi:ribonuclease HI